MGWVEAGIAVEEERVADDREAVVDAAVAYVGRGLAVVLPDLAGAGGGAVGAPEVYGVRLVRAAGGDAGVEQAVVHDPDGGEGAGGDAGEGGGGGVDAPEGAVEGVEDEEPAGGGAEGEFGAVRVVVAGDAE
jgi:hypothetical protein